MNPFRPLEALEALRLIADKHMVGAKHAVQSGSKVYVSPAMFDLITKAEDEDDLRHVLTHIKVMHIPKPPNLLRLILGS